MFPLLQILGFIRRLRYLQPLQTGNQNSHIDLPDDRLYYGKRPGLGGQRRNIAVSQRGESDKTVINENGRVFPEQVMRGGERARLKRFKNNEYMKP